MATPRRNTIPLSRLPHLTVTRHRWVTAALSCAVIAVLWDAAMAVSVAFGAVDRESALGRIGWGSAWLFMMGVSACNIVAGLAVSPRRGVFTYTTGHQVPVTFRPDPDRGPDTYRAYLRGTRTPVTHVTDIAHIRINGGQLHHILRLGPHSVRIADLVVFSGGISFTNPPVGGPR